MDDTDTLIIRELLTAEGEFVSGSQLAELVNMSRVSVWARMEKLRSQGFDFEAVRSKGYRLTQTPKGLNETLLQARLTHAASDLHAIVLDEIDSTNSEAERRLANGERTPFVILAHKQVSGRGRLGRSWHSESNGNLYASFAFRPQISPARMSLFTLWMGVNLCECINSLCRIKCGVKWPNDLHIDNRKIAGILTEARMEADLVRDVVLGLGMNVNSGQEGLPDELKRTAISIKELTGNVQDINRLTAAVAGRVMIAYQAFLDDDCREALKQKWRAHDLLLNQSVSLLQGDNRIAGVAQGIDASGSLIIQCSDGTRFHARAGEVAIEKSH